MYITTIYCKEDLIDVYNELRFPYSDIVLDKQRNTITIYADIIPYCGRSAILNKFPSMSILMTVFISFRRKHYDLLVAYHIYNNQIDDIDIGSQDYIDPFAIDVQARTKDGNIIKGSINPQPDDGLPF